MANTEVWNEMANTSQATNSLLSSPFISYTPTLPPLPLPRQTHYANNHPQNY